MTVPANGIAVAADGIPRCWWSVDNPLRRYHDREWGRPTRDDRRIFEKICLEGFQSGLSWLTILRKRENFRKAFEAFDYEAVARFNDRRIDRLMADAGIVRNKAKILATVNNARRCPELVSEFGSLAAYVWSFEPDERSRPKRLDWATLVGLGPSQEASALSKDLRRRGWAFVGPTTIHSVMESVGLVNDHVTGCYARGEIEKERASFRRPKARPSRARGGSP